MAGRAKPWTLPGSPLGSVFQKYEKCTYPGIPFLGIFPTQMLLDVYNNALLVKAKYSEQPQWPTREKLIH